MENFIEQIDKRRTFAIISHPDAGKTTLTEKLLLYGGAIQQAGIVKGKKGARAAVSDWMEIEKQRGISVTSSVLQFRYNGYCVNILDTPGHQDFSEDTYRTLMAADSAVMVIDGAKGVEPQTRKLFRVCALRHIPIFTFINKMDRETRDPLELCEEVERELGIDTYAVNWPIGSGKEFLGVYDRNKQEILHFSSNTNAKKSGTTQIDLDAPVLIDMLGQTKRDQLIEDIERAVYEANHDEDWVDAMWAGISIEENAERRVRLAARAAAEEAREVALAEGEAIGEAKGKAETRAQYNVLVAKLASEGRIDELATAVNNPAKLDALFAELA